MVIGPFVGALVVVFVAELGDKTQLAALALSTRYPPARVLAGVTLGFAVITLVGVAVGGLLAEAVPADALVVVAGLLFLAFGARELVELRALRASGPDAQLPDAECSGVEVGAAPPADRGGRSAVLTSALTIGVAELGDKTQLTAAALAANTSGLGLVGVWAGATLGEVAACGLAIGTGHLLRDRLAPQVLVALAAGAFILAGVATLATLVL